MSDYFRIEVPNPFYLVRVLIEWLRLKCIGMATDCIIVPIDNFQIIMAYYPFDQWFRLQNLFIIRFKCQVEKWNQTWAWTQIRGFLIEQGPGHQLDHYRIRDKSAKLRYQKISQIRSNVFDYFKCPKIAW